MYDISTDKQNFVRLKDSAVFNYIELRFIYQLHVWDLMSSCVKYVYVLTKE